MKTIKDQIKELEREIAKIQQKADEQMDRIYERINKLRDKCPHYSRHGDAYDDWCDECGRKM